MPPVSTNTKWKLVNLIVAYNFSLQGAIYYFSRCSSRIRQRWRSLSSQTAEQRKHSRSSARKTYGADQEEFSGVLNHSDKPNEFPRSTEWVFVLFSERGLEFQSKSLQQRWVWKWSASYEMKGEGAETNANHLLLYRRAIQHLAEKEPERCWCLPGQTVRMTVRPISL